MSWEYPCRRADVTGRQVLTKEKPIGKAYGALQELQEKVPVAADVQISGLEVTQAYVANNTLVLRGAVRKVYTPGGGEDLEARVAALETSVEYWKERVAALETSVEYWKERVAALENALRNISLSVNLAINQNALGASGVLSIGQYGAHFGGSTVEVEGC
jgi:hypothetical protein